MPVQRAKNGRWRYRAVVRLPDGTKARISGSAPEQFNTKTAAQQAERDHIARAQRPATATAKQPAPKEVPTFDEWFHGRFWSEWVVGRKNKPTERRSKTTIYECHLGPVFGPLRLDQIGAAEVARFRAALVAQGLSDKRINNILAVLSKALKYAAEVEVIEKAPRIGLFKVERPEIVAWDFEEYARVLASARLEGEDWYAAAALTGEAGLRIGEVKALRWREDVDLIAKTVTVNQQTRNGETTTPKGRTRRTIPMTETLLLALRRMEVIREGLVVRNLDGTAKTDGQADAAIQRICRRAGLPVRYWHTLRHALGTHAALCGVNPWRLQAWMGHKRIDETMLYIHVAEAHARELPEPMRDAMLREPDPDRRIVKMLGARAQLAPRRGNHVATVERAGEESAAIPAA